MDILDRIENKLRALDGLAAWELTENAEKRWEFYYIRHALDQNRAVDVRTVGIKLYREIEDGGERFLGNAYGELPATASEAELDRTLRDLLYQASLVKNPPYTLTDTPVTVEGPGPGSVDVAGIAEAFLRAMQRLPETETEDINSYELFVSEHTRRFRNSRGVSYSVTYPGAMLEVVVNAREDAADRPHEIELYRNYRSGACDGERLAADIARVLRYGHDRLAAVPTPARLDVPVLLSTDDAVEVYSFFTARTSASLKVRGISTYEIGAPIVSRTGGDPITLRALSSLPNSAEDYPVDTEGSVIEDRALIEGDIVRGFWGERQFSQYLGLDKSAIVRNWRVEGGSTPAEALRAGDYLEIVEFSDFQVDPMGGDIAGEIRLGYLHRGDETRIVTGGSVSGSLIEAAATMAFSRETVQYNRYVIPAVTRLSGLKLTGSE